MSSLQKLRQSDRERRSEWRGTKVNTLEAMLDGLRAVSAMAERMLHDLLKEDQKHTAAAAFNKAFNR